MSQIFLLKHNIPCVYTKVFKGFFHGLGGGPDLGFEAFAVAQVIGWHGAPEGVYAKV